MVKNGNTMAKIVEIRGKEKICLKMNTWQS